MKRKHNGQGGAWHAWVSIKHSGKIGSAGFKRRAEGYTKAHADDPDKIRAQRLGASVTNARRRAWGLAGGFGKKASATRDVILTKAAF